jgi:hypothetical protein
MSRLTAAEAWCWASHLLSQEAIKLDYAWPPETRDPQRVAELEAESAALYARATSLDASDDLWQRSVAKFEVHS